MEKIASYLTLVDMKVASEVSKSFCAAIRGTTVFADRAKLLVCKETVGLGTFLVDTTYPWKAAEIDCSMPETLFDIITDILESVQTLHLRLKWMEKVDNGMLVQFLTNVLTNTPKLQVLRVSWICFIWIVILQYYTYV